MADSGYDYDIMWMSDVVDQMELVKKITHLEDEMNIFPLYLRRFKTGSIVDIESSLVEREIPYMDKGF